VVVSSGDARTVTDRRGHMALDPRDWAGWRTRFWAIVARSDGGGVLLDPLAAAMVIRLDQPAPAPERLEWRWTFYSGPVERGGVRRADPIVDGMRLSGLWSWLRALALALQWLLNGLTAITGSTGAGIIALAVSVKILLMPVAEFAERLQEQVNATQA